jgi:hypothetical protein
LPTKQAKRARIALLLVGIVLIASGVVLLQTALFHVNPIKSGFRRFDYGDCVIYSKESSAEEEYQELRAAMQQNESALQLRYRARIKLILCKSQRDIDRYLPLVNRRDRERAGGFALWPNTVYITPKIKEKYGNLRGVLVHELSHILLLQNYGIVRCTRLWKRQEWIPEGFAVFYARWPIYFTRERLPDSIANAGIDMNNGRLLGNKPAKELPLPIRFMIYFYFIDYLHKNNDESQLLAFLQRTCANPAEAESIFKESFGRSLSEYVKAFALSLSEE